MLPPMKKTTIYIVVGSILIISLIFIGKSRTQSTENLKVEKKELTLNQIKRLITKKVADINNAEIEYQENVKNTGYPTVLLISRIKNDVEFSQTDRILTTTDSLHKDYKIKSQKYFIEWKNLIRKIPNKTLSEDEKESTLQKIQSKIELASENYKADSTAMITIRKIVSILKNGKCQYKITGENISFYDRNCLSKYQKLQNELNWSIMEQQNKIVFRKIDKTLNKGK